MLEVGRRDALLADGAVDGIALAVPRLVGAPLGGHAQRPVVRRLAALRLAIGARVPQPRLLLVEHEELERLIGRHRRDRRDIVGAPGIVAAALGLEAGEQRQLDPLIPQLKREAHLAREGGIVIAQLVEGRVREARGARREADVCRGAERGEERLLVLAGEAALRGGAELEAAVGEAGDLGFGGWGGGRACLARLPLP